MKLNAILCVWNEEDIINATVRHALAQGCDAVYLIDNDSADRTVQQAVRAGAVYHARFSTEVFDEAQKTVYINKCVSGINRTLPGERNWWLYIDADEFPDFGNGQTIRENLALLPDDVRAVGGIEWLHLPTHEPYYVPGWHPADFSPMAERPRESIFKYNLLRHDSDQPPIYAMSGAHMYNANGGSMREADITFLLHHFNNRRLESGKRRLEELVLPDQYGKRRVDWLDRMARANGGEQHFYHERLAQLESRYSENRLANLKVDTLPYDFKKLIRWYDPAQIALPPDMRSYDREVWLGTQARFMKDYAVAAEHFRNAAAQAEETLGVASLCSRCAQEAEQARTEARLALDAAKRCLELAQQVRVD